MESKKKREIAHMQQPLVVHILCDNVQHLRELVADRDKLDSPVTREAFHFVRDRELEIEVRCLHSMDELCHSQL